MRTRLHASFGLAALLAIALSWQGCDGEAEPCENATCVCEAGASCDIPCAAPPCHLECAGDNPSCTGACGNGDCLCGEGATCDFTCQSPPCHVTCEAETTCSGSCANGSCSCAAGASCDFNCDAGPCHVSCGGDNPRCDGVCANGTCDCGEGGVCTFSCLDDNCSSICGAGSSCVLLCPDGDAGAGCDFTSCAAGDPITCPGGLAVACDAPCP